MGSEGQGPDGWDDDLPDLVLTSAPQSFPDVRDRESLREAMAALRHRHTNVDAVILVASRRRGCALDEAEPAFYRSLNSHADSLIREFFALRLGGTFLRWLNHLESH